jgi:hypothetical protein
MVPLPGQINPEISIKSGLHRFLLWRDNNKNTFNFIAILFFLILLPPFEDNLVAREFIDILFLAVLFFAVQAISDNLIPMITGFGLGILGAVSIALYYFAGDISFHNASIIIGVIFFGFVAVVIFVGVIREKNIDRDAIFGAISVYLLIGITWAMGIMGMETLCPGSFSIGSHGPAQLIFFSDFIGYSFSILTTTGNYAVSPLTATARMVVMFEMMIGTLYIAVLISWLVGKFLGSRQAG